MVESVRNFVNKYKLQVSIFGVFILLYLLFLIGNPQVFLKFNIYYSFMSTIPFFGIMALSVTLIVVLGEIDLSFPSVLGFSAIIFGKVIVWTESPWIAAFACLLVGTLAGFINSVLIVRIGIPSIVATIGTMFFWRGGVNVIAQGQGVSLTSIKDTLFHDLLVGRVFDTIPAQFIWFVVLTVCFFLLLNRHKIGSHILMVGDNKESARMMGINNNFIKTFVYMQMGFFAAVSGIMCSMEVNYVWPTQGSGYLLTSLACVFIGGTSVFGGKGTIMGTFIGALIIGSLEAGIIAIGLTSFWLQFVYGLIIITAVSIYALFLRKPS